MLRRADAQVLHLDARTLYERSVTWNLRLSSDGDAVVLEEGELFEDDGPAAGYSYRPNEEKLSANTGIKKELVVPNPSARKATLLLARGGDIQAVVNGRGVKLHDAGMVGNYWRAYGFDPGALKPGLNQIVIHGSGMIWIARDDEFSAGSRTRTRHPNRSAKSADGGKTWDYDRLGTGGGVDGEYYVRLFLNHYRPRGSLTLPVIDAGNLAGKPVGPPLASIGPVEIAMDAEMGSAGRINVRARSGSTYVPDKRNWSEWQELGGRGGTLGKPAGRYVQIALDLATDDPLLTPGLNAVSLKAAANVANDWTRSLRVLESHNEEIVRTSIPFEYEPFDQPRLRTLRERYRLDEVVKGYKGEFELMVRLARWSSQALQGGHLGESYPPWDALEILKIHEDGRPVGGFCQQYNLVFLQACESFGLVGRAVSIGAGNMMNRIRGGHEVIEIWSNEYRKWVYVDGNTAYYAVDEQTQVPMSLLELRERQLNAFEGRRVKPIRIVNIADTRYVWKELSSWPPFMELRLIPRSNFMEVKSPVPLNQGKRGWFWTGHYVWTDHLLPARLIYGNRVSKRGNWQWTLNQAHYVLEATPTPGELRVHLDTETPGFEGFLADVDGGGRQAVPAVFIWKLKPGENRLEVLPRNKAAREGIVSYIVLDYRGEANQG